MKLKRLIPRLLIPLYSIWHGVEILLDGLVDLCTKIKWCFARGPFDEMKEYSLAISEFLRRKFGI